MYCKYVEVLSLLRGKWKVEVNRNTYFVKIHFKRCKGWGEIEKL